MMREHINREYYDLFLKHLLRQITDQELLTQVKALKKIMTDEEKNYCHEHVQNLLDMQIRFDAGL